MTPLPFDVAKVVAAISDPTYELTQLLDNTVRPLIRALREYAGTMLIDAFEEVDHYDDARRIEGTDYVVYPGHIDDAHDVLAIAKCLASYRFYEASKRVRKLDTIVREGIPDQVRDFLKT